MNIILRLMFTILPRISEFFRPCDPKNCLIPYQSRGLHVFVFQQLAKKLLAEVLSLVSDHCLEVRVEERVFFFETIERTCDHNLNEKLF
jgi:hypothetical protein